MTTLPYNRLSSDEIRVLTLLPGQYHEPLSGRLTTAKFSPSTGAVPDFEALSYTWGDQSNPELITITLDSGLGAQTTSPHSSATLGVVAIGPNLVAALRQLRSPSEPRLLWCDSICINQGDLGERGSQVLLMGGIYTHTRRVVVWLGIEADESRLAMNTLRYAGSQTDESSITQDAAANLVSFREDADPRYRGQSNKLPFSDAEWQAIAKLISRSWFKRLWIRQEITLANSNALVVVGDQEITWTQLLGAVALIRSKVTAPSKCSSDADVFRQDLTNISTFRRMKGGRNLHGAISYTRNCECTDDRDRVYALLDMINPEISKTIRPDYSLGVKSVYRDMVLKAIQYSERLTILDFCDSATRPSWVPDLHKRQTFLERFDFTYASGDSEATPRVLDGDRLEVDGVECDVVLEQVATIPNNVSDKSLKRIISTILIKVLGFSIDSWKQEQHEEVTQSLLAGRTFELTEWINYPRLARSALVLKQWASDTANATEESRVLAALQEILPGRSVYRTESGSLVIASGQTRPGDYIYTLLGFSITMTLRATSNRGEFHVVGPVYHPRFARGEALCGELPEGWRAVVEVGVPGPVFKKKGLLWQKTDPRMVGVDLPAGWEEGDDEDDGWPYWYDDGKGEVFTWSDPRLRPKELAKRNIRVKAIVLI